MKSFSRYHLCLLTASILAVLLLATGCSASPTTEAPGGQDNLSSQEQSLESVDSSDGTGSDDPPVLKDQCPQDIVYKLQLNHQFDYSPNRQTDLMQVTGRTSENAWCLVTIAGAKVSADDCIVDYDFDGFMQTDEGKCSITGSSTALISIKGECLPSQHGEPPTIFLEITETADPDGVAGGNIDCPGYSGPYLGFYAPSYYIADFPVSDDPTADSTIGPDPGGQFEYLKQYTLIPVVAP